MSLVKIINYEHQRYAADLIGAHYNPTGPVEGFEINTRTNNQSWDVVTHVGNLITIRNRSSGTYANPTSESENARIVGRETHYEWQLLSEIVGGWYQIATRDGRYVWYLTGGHDYAPIILRARPYEGKDAQWDLRHTSAV